MAASGASRGACLPSEYSAEDDGCVTRALHRFRVVDEAGDAVELHTLSWRRRAGQKLRAEGECLLPLPMWLHLGEGTAPPMVLEDGSAPPQNAYTLPLDSIAAFHEEGPAVGELLDAFCPRTRKWFEAKVLAQQQQSVTVHFKGWKAKYDETLEVGSWRLAPHKVMTAVQRCVAQKRPIVLPRSLVCPVHVSIPRVEDWCVDHSGRSPSLWLIAHDAWYRLSGPVCQPHATYRSHFERAGVLFWLTVAVVHTLQLGLARASTFPFWRAIRALLSALHSDFPDLFVLLETNTALAVRSAENRRLETVEPEELCGAVGEVRGPCTSPAPTGPVSAKEPSSSPATKLFRMSTLLLRRLRGENALVHLENLLLKHADFLLEQLRAVAHPRAGESSCGETDHPEDQDTPFDAAAGETSPPDPAEAGAENSQDNGPPHNATLADTALGRMLESKRLAKASSTRESSEESGRKARPVPSIPCLPEDSAYWRERLRLGFPPPSEAPPASHTSRRSATFFWNAEEVPEASPGLWDLCGQDVGAALEVWASLRHLIAPLATHARALGDERLVGALPSIASLASPEALVAAVATGAIAPVCSALVRAALEPRLAALRGARMRSSTAPSAEGPTPASACAASTRSATLAEAIDAALSRNVGNFWNCAQAADEAGEALEAAMPWAWPLLAECLVAGAEGRLPLLETYNWLADARRLLAALCGSLDAAPSPPGGSGGPLSDEAQVAEDMDLCLVGGAQLFQRREGLRPAMQKGLGANPNPSLSHAVRRQLRRCWQPETMEDTRTLGELLEDLVENAMRAQAGAGAVAFVDSLLDKAHDEVRGRVAAWASHLQKRSVPDGEMPFPDVSVSHEDAAAAIASLRMLWSAWEPVFQAQVVACVRASDALRSASPGRAAASVGALMSRLRALVSLVLRDSACGSRAFGAKANGGPRTPVVDLSEAASADASTEAGIGLQLRWPLLGQDRDFRRFYVFESETQAPRVFVESADGSRWWLYDDRARILALHTWLRGDLRRESSLKAGVELLLTHARASVTSAAPKPGVQHSASETGDDVLSTPTPANASERSPASWGHSSCTALHACVEALRSTVARARLSGYGDAFEAQRRSFCDGLDKLQGRSKVHGEASPLAFAEACELALRLEDALHRQGTVLQSQRCLPWGTTLRQCRARLLLFHAEQGHSHSLELALLVATATASLGALPHGVDAEHAHKLLQPRKLRDTVHEMPKGLREAHGMLTTGAFCRSRVCVFHEGQAEAEALSRVFKRPGVWGQRLRASRSTSVGEGFSFSVLSATRSPSSTAAPSVRKRKRNARESGAAVPSLDADASDERGDSRWTRMGVFAQCSIKACDAPPPRVRVVAPVAHSFASCVALWLLSELVDRDAAEPFLDVPDPQEHPAYLDEVLQPMSLSMVQDKAQEGAYASVSDIHADFMLLKQNCDLYCAERYPSVVHLADELVTAAASLLESVRRRFASLQASTDALGCGFLRHAEPYDAPAAKAPSGLTFAIRFDPCVPRYVVPEGDIPREISLGQWVQHAGNRDANGWVLAVKEAPSGASDISELRLLPCRGVLEGSGDSCDVECVWRQLVILWAKPYLGQITCENSWDLSFGDCAIEEHVVHVSEEEGFGGAPRASAAAEGERQVVVIDD